MSSTLTRVLLPSSACLGAAVIWALSRSHLPFFSDDALISLRYADRLLAGHGLTFTGGERVEGYSNLLWVLAIAAGGLVHRDLIEVTRAIGVGCAGLTVAALVWGGLLTRAGWGTLAAVGALVASHGVVLWAIGGLEQPLQLALLAWALVLTAESDGATRTYGLGAGVCLALLALTRPDGLLFAATTACAWLLARGLSRPALGSVAPIVILPALAWLGQLAFRLAYYGDWWSNTAYVKLSWSVPHAWQGWAYVTTAARTHAPVLLLATAIVVTSRHWRRPEWIAPVLALLAWTAYVVSIGGDIFPGRRHFLPILVCAAVATVVNWRHSLVARLPWLAQAALIAITLVPYARLQAHDPENRRAREEVWEWECGTMATVLRDAFESTAPLIAADPAGCVSYFGRLPTLDMLGLNDRHIARTRPADFGHGYIGHELGDGGYVLSRRPDLVLLCHPGGSATGCFRSGTELVGLPAFHRDYVLTTLAPEGARYPTLLWARSDSRALGVQATRDTLRLPGLLFATNGGQAVLAGRRLVTRIQPHGTVVFDRVPVDSSTWHPFPQASAPVTVEMIGGAVRVAAGPSGADLSEVVLVRSGA